MNAKEIRKQWNESMLGHQPADNLPYVVADVLVEIAAQLAELNNHAEFLSQLGSCIGMPGGDAAIRVSNR